jgi:hypothetical protein
MWKGPDRGLIHCWELGRRRAKEESHLAESATQGELPPNGWKGGVPGKVKYKSKYGCLQYLAEWQGLRGDDLDIDVASEIPITCSLTGVTIIFTAESSKWELPGK